MRVDPAKVKVYVTVSEADIAYASLLQLLGDPEDELWALIDNPTSGWQRQSIFSTWLKTPRPEVLLPLEFGIEVGERDF